jgi:hypothetical protein
LDNEIENWTDDDTQELVSTMNWHARLFFPIKDRMERTIVELKRIHSQTGQQPRDLGQAGVAKIREGLPNGKISLIEKMVVNQYYFNSIMAFCIINAVFLYGSK